MKYGYIRPVTINDDLKTKKKIETYTKIVEESHANNKKNELDLLLKRSWSRGCSIYYRFMYTCRFYETISRYIRLSFTEGYIFICN